MYRSLNHYLNLLRDYDPLTEEQHVAFEARIRREVIARYGRFDVPMRATVHSSESARGGMLIFLRALRSIGGVGRSMLVPQSIGGLGRSALAFAVLGVLIVGGVVAMRRLGDVRSNPSVEPAGSSVSVVAVAEPVMPGSGVSVSVFGATSQQPQAASMVLPQTVRSSRPSGRRLNPAAGVFSQWGESVFSEEERLRSDRVGKNVFPNS
ncbi:MAG: hypothetical protein Q7R80_01850 [bacterium]|nr:hypothetical protein [bacterium]